MSRLSGPQECIKFSCYVCIQETNIRNQELINGDQLDHLLAQGMNSMDHSPYGFSQRHNVRPSPILRIIHGQDFNKLLLIQAIILNNSL